MSGLVADRITGNATRLGLTHLAADAVALAERAEAAQQGYLEFLDLVLEEEVGMRAGRRFRNALKLFGLPHHKTLDQFDFAFQPDLDPARSATSPRSAGSPARPTWRCSAHPAWGRRIVRL